MTLGQSAGRGRKSPVRPHANARASLRQRNLIDPPSDGRPHGDLEGLPPRRRVWTTDAFLLWTLVGSSFASGFVAAWLLHP